jgi:hypothetical protein
MTCKYRSGHIRAALAPVALSICLLTAAFVHLAFAQAPPNGKSNSTTAPNRVYSAGVFSEISAEHSQPGGWCYESDPAFIFSKNRLLFRSDLKGNITQLMEAPYPITSLHCSEDGKTISFSNPEDTHFSILDVGSNQLSEYAITPPSPPASFSFSSSVSPDGSTFAMPPEFMLVSGPDILRNKRIIRVKSKDIYWTREFVFVRAIRKNNRDSFIIQRMSDLSEIGILKFPANRLIASVFGCAGYYFAWYDDDEANVQPINDPRLSATINKRSGGGPSSYGFCVIGAEMSGQENYLKTIRFLRDGKQTTVDLRNVDSFLTGEPPRFGDAVATDAISRMACLTYHYFGGDWFSLTVTKADHSSYSDFCRQARELIQAADIAAVVRDSPEGSKGLYVLLPPKCQTQQ